MKKYLTLFILIGVIVSACTSDIDNSIMQMELSEEPLVLLPIKDSSATVQINSMTLDPTIRNHALYDGPYEMTVTVGSSIINNYNNTGYVCINGTIPIQYIRHIHTGIKRVLHVGSI